MKHKIENAKLFICMFIEACKRDRKYIKQDIKPNNCYKSLKIICFNYM